MCLPLLAAIPAVGAAASAASSVGLGTIATLAGTGLSAYGAIQQGNAQKAAADAQAAAFNNQAIATMQQGQYAATRKQEEINKIMGSYIAQGAGSGLDLSSGSLADGAASIASNGALDIGAIQTNALAQSQNLSYQARLARRQGRSARQAGMIGAAGGVFDSVTRLGLPFGTDMSLKSPMDDTTAYGTGRLY